MPWEIEKRSGEFCVINQTSGEEEDCHATRTAANSHMAALYASEKSASKEVPMEKCMDEYRPYGGATTFDELQAQQDAADAAWAVRDLTWQFQDMVGNIMVDEGISDKGAAVVALSNEFSDLVEKAAEGAKSKSLWVKVKEALLGKKQEEKGTDEPQAQEEGPNSFMVWKDGDEYRWLALYSNKFRDEDNPPEILSEESHKGFVGAVDAGEWDYPETWLWHTPGTKCGVCDFVAYDDQGFAIASGIIEDEEVAKALAARDDLKVSHGMPSKEIERDPDDPTIITRYRTSEISPLPAWAAANQLTSFSMGGNMAIPKEKKQFLTEVMGEDRTAALEEELGTLSKSAEGMEYKETEAPAEEEAKDAEEEAQEAAPAEEVEEVTGDPEVDESQYVTRDEVVEEIGGVFAEFGERLTAMEASIEGLGKSLKELERSEEERIAEKAAETPAASLGDMVRQRAVGAPEAQVDGRTREGKAGPAERIAENGPTPSTFLNTLMAASQGQPPQ